MTICEPPAHVDLTDLDLFEEGASARRLQAAATFDYEDRSLGEQSTRSREASAAMFEYGSRLLALIDHPEQWAALKRDRSLLEGAIEEMLRWASSTTYNRRTATRRIVRHGEVMQPGDKVVLWWQAANFDDRVFRDPMRFDIERTPNPHLAFGVGPHFCLGANLARLEIRLVFGALLDRVEACERAGPIERTRSNKHAGFRHAPIRFRAAMAG